MVHKTNAARILDLLDIKYEIKEYEVDPKNLDAISVSKHCDASIEKIYKTIVCISNTKENIVACLQGDMKLDLKALAKAADLKRCELIEVKNIEKITGYVRGGCSPIGMKHKFRTFIDKKALLNEKIYISAGVRGKQIILDPKDLVKAVDAKVCSIAL